jgi:hypothetical protein
MEISSDFADLLRAFNAEAVRYLVIGALAVSFHDQPRATADFDVWVERSRDNAERVHRALVKFGAPVEHLSVDDLTSDDLVYMIGAIPLRIDVLTDISGVAFERAWPRRVGTTVAGVPANVIGLDDLIDNKRAAGRDKDEIDVRRLLRRRERSR